MAVNESEGHSPGEAEGTDLMTFCGTNMSKDKTFLPEGHSLSPPVPTSW